jgi:putative transposase
VSDRFALIGAEEADPTSVYPVTLMCRLLEVSTSGFYESCSALSSARARRRATVSTHVQAAFDAGRGTYGVRRVQQVLARSTDPQVASVSLKMVRSVMAELDLHACQPRAYKVTTVQDGSVTLAIPDLLHRDFTSDTPGAKMVGDITYSPTWEGWLFLATVLDCHSKAVIGWAMAEHMRTDLICDAITMAATHTQLPAGAVFHSDRGAQYTSAQFAEHLKENGITASMGRTGICWDNAMAESFFGALKNELIYRTFYTTREKARRAIAEYIEVFHNRQRLHSGLGYKTPLEVANAYQQKPTLAA